MIIGFSFGAEIYQDSLVRSSHLPPNPSPALDLKITPEVVKEHGLVQDEYEVITHLMRRMPSLTELGIFSVLWSERCSYKNTKALLKQFPVTRDGDTSKFGEVLVKAGEENAGVVDIGGGWAIAFKIESHNHPSAIAPFEGAATGVGGIIRDIFTMGAKPVLLTNSLRLGELSSAESKRLFRGVVAGVAHYAKEIGLPVVGGDVHFDKSFEGRPLVNTLCLGVLRHDEIRRGKASGAGNTLYHVGARTGRDGLRAAALAASVSPEAKLPVQNGDPVVGKRLIEACLEALASPGLVVGIEDMGAAGLSGALCEAAHRGAAGVEIELDQVPVCDSSMNSYEIMLSESQERMLVVVRQGREPEFEAFMAKHSLQAGKIGVVTDSARLLVKHHGVPVADIPIASLTEKAPVYYRESMVPSYFASTSSWTPQGANLADLDQKGVQLALPRLLASHSVASKRWVSRQYEAPVGAVAWVEACSDAAIVRVVLDGKPRIIAISNDCNSRYCYLNPRRGAQIAMVESLRNLACSGAIPLAMTNNLNFGNPYKPENFYQLKESIRGLAEASRFFDVPVLGGNVSLYNETADGAVDPSPVVSVVGLVEDERHVTRLGIGGADERLVLLGGAPSELGGSQFLGVVHGLKTGDAPAVDLGAEERLVSTIRTLIRSGLVSAAHDLSEGGLLIAVCEMLFASGKGLGAHLDLNAISGGRNDALLFGESQGCVILSVKPDFLGRVISEAHLQGVSAVSIGEVSSDGGLQVKTRSLNAQWTMANLRKVWENALDETMR